MIIRQNQDLNPSMLNYRTLPIMTTQYYYLNITTSWPYTFYIFTYINAFLVMLFYNKKA